MEAMRSPKLHKTRLITHGKPPYYAYFEHPDGSWYMVWMTETFPKTERGHRFHVHTNYDKLGTVKPNPQSRWYEQPYGMRNWDFDNLKDATIHFYCKRFLPRLHHGYRLIMGNVPPEWLPNHYKKQSRSN
jgi:hypothetical protein